MCGEPAEPPYYSFFIFYCLFYVNPSAALVPLKRGQARFLDVSNHIMRTHAVRPYEPEI